MSAVHRRVYQLALDKMEDTRCLILFFLYKWYRAEAMYCREKGAFNEYSAF